MIVLTQDAYNDSDGFEGVSDGDRFGVCIDSSDSFSFYSASGLKIFERDQYGELAFSEDFMSDISADLVTKLRTWMKADGVYMADGNDDTNGSAVAFAGGNAMFCVDRLSVAYPFENGSKLNSSGWERGILPLPKYDETHQDYTTALESSFTLWGLTIVTKDPVMSTAVLECLASEGMQRTTPAVLGSVFGMRDVNSEFANDFVEMFGLCRNAII